MAVAQAVPRRSKRSVKGDRQITGVNYLTIIPGANAILL
jgi:hypothetical protein